VKETELEKSELTNRLKLAIGIPANEKQSSIKPRITELFIKAQNLIKNSYDMVINKFLSFNLTSN